MNITVKPNSEPAFKHYTIEILVESKRDEAILKEINNQISEIDDDDFTISVDMADELKTFTQEITNRVRIEEAKRS